MENLDEELIKLFKTKLIIEHENQNVEKKCLVMIGSKCIYIWSYTEMICLFPLKEIVNLTFKRKKHELEIHLFRGDSVKLRMGES